ncbi:lymphatic vessel endothelial hyaluronic receptor 1b [Pungitius pungitius]|uniref:lymphatic vessel endothelial hyaluronic receptor 1b n=1 Tax=Pungitius pungitius TaxID=134920 RepID=UPI002E10B9AF
MFTYPVETMVGFSFSAPCFFLSLAAVLLASDSDRTRVPRSDRAAGVFMLIDGGEYTFNSSAAGAACRSLNVTIATRAQVERAQRSGLETCKYGWIAERVAVVPRHTADQKCGRGTTGVVMWRANLDRKFGVFCFNASDFVETPNSSTAGARSSPPPTTRPPSPAPAGPSLTSATRPPPSMAPTTSTNAPEQTPLPSTITPLIETTHSTRISTSTPPPLKPSSTHISTSLSQLRTSKPSTFFTSARAFSFALSAQSATSQPTSSATPSSGNVATALIILGSIIGVVVVVVVAVIAAVLLVRNYKLDVFTYWTRGTLRDDTETEMWKHGDSETDLYGGREGGEEESDRKYSSDITLCVNPVFRTNSSQ